MVLQIQSKCYKRRLRRKIEKERQKKIRRNEIKRIVTRVQTSFEEESSNELDENLNENLDELLESDNEIFCEQNEDTVIASNRFLYNRYEHTRESHDSGYEINNDNFVADSDEELSSSNNNITNYNESNYPEQLHCLKHT